jgi:N-acetylmuramoyl-L-alanine amidase
MRAKGIPVQQIILGLALLAGLCWNLAHASEINDLRVSAGATGTRAEIGLDTQVEYRILTLSNPERLVVDLPGADPVRGLKLPAAAGLVKDVRTGHPVPGTTRIVFDLLAPVVALKPRFESGANGTRLVVEWPGDAFGDPIARIAAATANRPVAAADPQAGTASTAQSPPLDPAIASAAATSRLVAATTAAARSSTQPTPAPLPPPVPQASGTIATGVPTRIATGVPTPVTDPKPAPVAAPTVTPPPLARRAGMRPLIVAIDAGHGGQDPGAIGKSGRREKDVTLAVSRELAKQVNATPGLKAYLTRDKDVFIPLNRRAQLARAAKADIFVSIHADAAENRSASGASVYVLSLKGASSQRARWLADKENAADLIGGRMPQAGNTLASVLLDLTQSGHMKASEDAARHVLGSLGDVGNTRRVEHANFAVLRTSDMPAMLVETAYISNPAEERQLTDPGYQRKLAGAILRGVDTYFLRQPPPGTMYAARASAQADSAAGGSP